MKGNMLFSSLFIKNFHSVNYKICFEITIQYFQNANHKKTQGKEKVCYLKTSTLNISILKISIWMPKTKY